MEPNDNLELHELLQEWQAPAAPSSLDARVLRPRKGSRSSAWCFLLTGSIRVPVPVACCLVALLAVLAWRLATPAEPSPPQIVVQPQRVEVPVDRVVERIVYRDRPAPTTAEGLVELLPVTELRARIIRGSSDDTN